MAFRCPAFPESGLAGEVADVPIGLREITGPDVVEDVDDIPFREGPPFAPDLSLKPVEERLPVLAVISDDVDQDEPPPGKGGGRK